MIIIIFRNECNSDIKTPTKKKAPNCKNDFNCGIIKAAILWLDIANHNEQWQVSYKNAYTI